MFCAKLDKKRARERSGSFQNWEMVWVVHIQEQFKRADPVTNVTSLNPSVDPKWWFPHWTVAAQTRTLPPPWTLWRVCLCAAHLVPPLRPTWRNVVMWQSEACVYNKQPTSCLLWAVSLLIKVQYCTLGQKSTLLKHVNLFSDCLICLFSACLSGHEFLCNSGCGLVSLLDICWCLLMFADVCWPLLQKNIPVRKSLFHDFQGLFPQRAESTLRNYSSYFYTRTIILRHNPHSGFIRALHTSLLCPKNLFLSLRMKSN